MTPEAPLPGIVFGVGRHQNTTDIQRDSSTGWPREIANYRSQIDPGPIYSRTTELGYVRVALPRAYPHVLLDLRANNAFGFSNLPFAVARTQRVRLDRARSRLARLYAAPEHADWGRGLFTVELLTEMHAQRLHVDIEIVDTQLFLYQARPFSLTRPGAADRALAFASLVAERITASDAPPATAGARLPGRRRLAGPPPWAVFRGYLGVGVVLVAAAFGLAALLQ